MAAPNIAQKAPFKAEVEAQTSSQVVLLKPGETHSA